MDDKKMMESIARLTKEYDSGLSATIPQIMKDTEENGYPMDRNRLINCVRRLRDREQIDSYWMRVGDNFYVDENGERKRMLPVRRGYILTYIGWKDLTQSDAI